MAKTNTAELGFEKQIWRKQLIYYGNMDASEYNSVVLGLIFLKYISDSFEAKHQALINEGKALRKTKMNIPMSIFSFVPKEARWSVIAEAWHILRRLVIIIDNAMRLIEKENPRLKVDSS